MYGFLTYNDGAGRDLPADGGQLSEEYFRKKRARET